MKSARIILGAILAMAVTAGVLHQSLAQGSKPQPLDAERLALAKEFLSVTSKAQRFDQIVPLLTNQLAMAFKRRNPGKSAEIDDVMQRLSKRFVERQSEMVDLIAPIYAERFSAAEMKEIIAFYRTPVGKRILEEMPHLMQRAVQIGINWGQRIGREVEAEARRQLQDKGIRL
ncbi:MAG: DUF2059 domain-containing protein [Hyphomicrobiaceae bacterium]